MSEIVHDELPGYLKTLLPSEFVSGDELMRLEEELPRYLDAPKPPFGIGDVVQLFLFHPRGGIPQLQTKLFRLFYVCAGTFTFRFENEDCSLSAGDVLFLAPGFSGSAAPCGAEDFGVLLSMDQSLFQERMDISDLPAFAAYLNSAGQHGAFAPAQPFLRFQTDGYPDAKWYLEELICEHLDPDRRTYLAFQNLLYLVFVTLDRCADVDFPTRRTASDQVMDAVLRFLKTNYASATLDATARRFGFSPNYLSQLLRKATGMTFRTLKQSICLKHGAQLLSETDRTISEISAAVGMRNLTRFYSLFSEQFGMTPAQYRREHRKDDALISDSSNF